jgi:hypothetical protein
MDKAKVMACAECGKPVKARFAKKTWVNSKWCGMICFLAYKNRYVEKSYE